MIQRYELELYDTEAGCDLHKSDNGDLCKYEDTQKLEQENERLRQALQDVHSAANSNFDHDMIRIFRIVDKALKETGE